VTCVGFRVKTGWAAVVLLAVEHGAPRVLDSRRVALVDPEDPDARQPYHAGFGAMQQDQEAIDAAVGRVHGFARRSLAALLADYGGTHRAPRCAAIVAGSDVDPARIANLHMRAHALEGRLYRDVVAESMSAAQLPALLFVERDLIAAAAHRPGHAPDRVKAVLAEIGRPGGRKLAGPWRAEEKSAALAAWIVHSDRSR
jgi:hypothetical protein